MLVPSELKLDPTKERVWCVGVWRNTQAVRDFQSSFEELQSLVDTAGGAVVGISQQKIDHPDSKTFLGKGKVEEIRQSVAQAGAETVTIDDELTPTQNRNLEEAWKVKVLDRTAVILDIFAKRAHTKEGRLQIELAQLRYMQPRLKGMWSHFSKQTGGIGTRGPGETQLEVDRRHVKERITKLHERLEEVRTHRMIHRQKREAVPLPLFALVGYTNAGKSTLFNALAKANVFVEDKLFATLDPTVRRLRLPSGRHILLADTVGFIRKLPHTLVEAFRATFEEIAYADALIHVVDVSDADAHGHIETVEEELTHLELNQKPHLLVYNKKDAGVAHANGNKGIPISALHGDGLERLLDEMELMLRSLVQRTRFLLPHSRGDILATLYTLGHVLHVEHRPEGTAVDCEIPPKFVQRYKEFLV